MGASQRTKGAVFERDLVHRFRAALPGVEIKRGFQTRGAEAPDVDVPGLWVEAKCGKKPNPRVALAQAVFDADEDRMPVVVIKDDYKEPFAVLRLDDLLAVLSELHVQKNLVGPLDDID